MHARPFRFLGIMEPIIERGIVEDIPSSLAAIRRAAEGRRGRRGAAPARGRAAVARADRVFEHFEELRAELTALYGDRQQLPNRKELLASGRCGSPATRRPPRCPCACGACVPSAGERRDRRSVEQRFTVAAATGRCGVCTQVFQTTHGGVVLPIVGRGSGQHPHGLSHPPKARPASGHHRVLPIVGLHPPPEASPLVDVRGLPARVLLSTPFWYALEVGSGICC